MSLSASTFLSLALIGVPSYFSPRRRRSSSFATVLLTCSERPDQFCFFHVSGGFTLENSYKPHPVIANNGMGFAATTLMTKHTEDHDSIAAHTSACVTVKRPLRLFGGAEVVFGVAKRQHIDRNCVRDGFYQTEMMSLIMSHPGVVELCMGASI